MAVTNPQIVLTASMGGVRLNPLTQIRDQAAAGEDHALVLSLLMHSLHLGFTHFSHLTEARRYLDLVLL